MQSIMGKCRDQSGTERGLDRARRRRRLRSSFAGLVVATTITNMASSPTVAYAFVDRPILRQRQPLAATILSAARSRTRVVENVDNDDDSGWPNSDDVGHKSEELQPNNEKSPLLTVVSALLTPIAALGMALGTGPSWLQRREKLREEIVAAEAKLAAKRAELETMEDRSMIAGPIVAAGTVAVGLVAAGDPASSDNSKNVEMPSTSSLSSTTTMMSQNIVRTPKEAEADMIEVETADKIEGSAEEDALPYAMRTEISPSVAETSNKAEAIMIEAEADNPVEAGARDVLPYALADALKTSTSILGTRIRDNEFYKYVAPGIAVISATAGAIATARALSPGSGGGHLCENDNDDTVDKVPGTKPISLDKGKEEVVALESLPIEKSAPINTSLVEISSPDIISFHMPSSSRNYLDSIGSDIAAEPKPKAASNGSGITSYIDLIGGSAGKSSENVGSNTATSTNYSSDVPYSAAIPAIGKASLGEEGKLLLPPKPPAEPLAGSDINRSNREEAKRQKQETAELEDLSAEIVSIFSSVQSLEAELTVADIEKQEANQDTKEDVAEANTDPGLMIEDRVDDREQAAEFEPQTDEDDDIKDGAIAALDGSGSSRLGSKNGMVLRESRESEPKMGSRLVPEKEANAVTEQMRIKEEQRLADEEEAAERQTEVKRQANTEEVADSSSPPSEARPKSIFYIPDEQIQSLRDLI